METLKKSYFCNKKESVKILLVGEYSNVHWTLAQGLRALGHEAVVVSDGDFWKDYPRDIDVRRRSLGRWDTLRFLIRLERVFAGLKGYDIVQLINPIFLDLKAERMNRYYQKLKKNNGKVVLGAYGMDTYWVRASLDCKTFRYSDFNMGAKERHSPELDAQINDWIGTAKEALNLQMAAECQGIVAGLYEYYVSYKPHWNSKLRYIPFPIRMDESLTPSFELKEPGKVHFFIGIQSTRNVYKGTDIMLRALLRLEKDYPQQVVVHRAENVPFETYQRMINNSDVLLDQLYSYTPAMNGLLALSHGLVLVGGGEPEHYDLLNESELRPIVNVLPTEESVYSELKKLVLNPQRIPELKRQGVEYIRRHHDYLKVAQQYLNFWSTL